MIGDLSENFHVSLGTATFCICLLKSQRFPQFICHIIWSRWFNIFVSDLSVVKNLSRFCFSVPYDLCIEKNDNMYIYIYIYIYAHSYCKLYLWLWCGIRKVGSSLTREQYWVFRHMVVLMIFGSLLGKYQC